VRKCVTTSQPVQPYQLLYGCTLLPVVAYTKGTLNRMSEPLPILMRRSCMIEFTMAVQSYLSG
jgi:hypothetical protein